MQVFKRNSILANNGMNWKIQIKVITKDCCNQCIKIKSVQKNKTWTHCYIRAITASDEAHALYIADKIAKQLIKNQKKILYAQCNHFKAQCKRLGEKIGE